LVSVVYVDLAWAHRGLLFSLKPERVFSGIPVLQPADVKWTRLFYYPSQRDLHPAYYSVTGRPTFEQAVSLSFQNYLPNVGVLHDIDYFQEIDALNRRPYSEFLSVANGMDFARQIKLLRTFNVGYLVSFRELPEMGIRLVGRFPKYFSWLYRVEGTVPRVYLVNEFLVEKEAAKVLQRLSDPDFDPLKEVILDTGASVEAFGELDAQATIERYENATVSVRVAADGDAILVLADSYYPGWKAFVDGHETEIFRANHFYRAVVLPKGEHRVEFHYRPQSFALGVVISVVALLFVAAVFLWVLLGERKIAARPTYASAQVLQD
ncbi:MAG TPA: YfhO family protein, partial [Methylomirabilota bacterium]|nr:YfhO family protein [Methylomirabilota bacterium]